MVILKYTDFPKINFPGTRNLVIMACFLLKKKLERVLKLNNGSLLLKTVGRVAQSVSRLTTGWKVRGSNPGGARFSARSDRPWGPTSLLYNGYQVFPGGKIRPGRAADHSPLLVPWSWKGRAIPLPTLWATTGPVTGTLYLYY